MSRALWGVLAGALLVVVAHGAALGDDMRAVRALERIAAALEKGACR